MEVIRTSNVKIHTGLRLMGMVLLVGGLVSIFLPYFIDIAGESGKSLWTGLAFGLIGFFMAGASNGNEVDLTQKKHRHYKYFWGYKWGEWSDIPELDGIYYLKHSYEEDRTPNGISPTVSGRVTDHHVLGLIDEDTLVFSLKYYRAEKAQQAADQLSKALNVPLK